jgi:hypothetical protein
MIHKGTGIIPAEQGSQDDNEQTAEQEDQIRTKQRFIPDKDITVTPVPPAEHAGIGPFSLFK